MFISGHRLTQQVSCLQELFPPVLYECGVQLIKNVGVASGAGR